MFPELRLSSSVNGATCLVGLLLLESQRYGSQGPGVMWGPQEELTTASYKFTSSAPSPLLKALLGKPIQVRSPGISL